MLETTQEGLGVHEKVPASRDFPPYSLITGDPLFPPDAVFSSAEFDFHYVVCSNLEKIEIGVEQWC